jgi:inhibitor of cysteine peptidase
VKLSALAIASLLLIFAGRSTTASPTLLTATDVGRPITLRLGDELVLNLECNPSTGYDWFLAYAKNPVLSIRGKPACQQSRSMPGAGGLESWNFRASGAGAQKLKLEYRRPWEKNTSPVKTVVFDITVH